MVISDGKPNNWDRNLPQISLHEHDGLEIGGTCSTHMGDEKLLRIFSLKNSRKGPTLGDHWYRYKDNIKWNELNWLRTKSWYRGSEYKKSYDELAINVYFSTRFWWCYSVTVAVQEGTDWPHNSQTTRTVGRGGIQQTTSRVVQVAQWWRIHWRNFSSIPTVWGAWLKIVSYASHLLFICQFVANRCERRYF